MKIASKLNRNSTKAIRVCTGPGCKGWGSNHLLQELQSVGSLPQGRGRRVCSTKCINRCGGGATVVVGSGKQGVLKFKDSLQAVSRLLSYLPSTV